MADTSTEEPKDSTKPHLQLPSLHCDLELPLGESTPTFNLEKAVCSHGLFIMAPNLWDPLTNSLLRPLRLSLSSNAASSLVRVSVLRPDALLVRVYGTRSLSSDARGAVVDQVRRMLRLEEREERKVREFQELHSGAKEVGFGRVFRSPTLFEDMVKAILFCNCQWPRTLSMAQALCDLQVELQCHSSMASVNALGNTKLKVVANGPESFTPGTPAVKESQRKRKLQKVLSREMTIDESEVGFSMSMNSALMAGPIHQLQENSKLTFVSSNEDENLDGLTTRYLDLTQSFEASSEGRVMDSSLMMGNFPSPLEIASLDEKYLAKLCGLGYRAGRILKLAQGVVEGKVQLSELEELCNEASLSNYRKAEEKLKGIEGYGPFTRGNVLMCLGFYNVIPTDSETIRHLKQVHRRTTTSHTVQKVVEEMYSKYEPYQFLAYWWELWSFYEARFGKFSEMPSSDYKLVTASNMRTKRKKE